MGDNPAGTDTIAPEARTAHVQSLITRLLSASPIYSFLLSDVRLHATRFGTVTTRLTLTPVHVNSRGGLHGAVSAAIVDFTTGLAIASWDLRPATGASVDMHISYLSTAAVGDELEIVSTAEKVGGALAFVTVRIAKLGGDDSTVVTLGQHTKYVRGTAPKQ